jgi:hypothetical protein
MKILSVTALSVALLSVGCAGWSNQIAHDGGIIGTYKGDYIIRNDSGGKIMDVWKLRNVYVEGGVFQDEQGNVLTIKGDLRIMRVNNSKDWDRYHEYHTEFETKSYQELYTAPSK